MKKLIWVCVAAMAAASCNNADNKGTGKDSTGSTNATATETVSQADLPYHIDNYREWEAGSRENKLILLNSLKKWEEGKIDESLKYFADSVKLEFDGPTSTVSNDSLKHIFSSGWNEYKTVSITVQDLESVISKDRKEAWATVWYRQVWETKKGVKDSTDIVNDAQIKDGKIIVLDEYTRKLH